jgi:hypothetical protein
MLSIEFKYEYSKLKVSRISHLPYVHCEVKNYLPFFAVVSPLCLLIIICTYCQSEHIEYLPLHVIIPKTCSENYNF